METTIISIFSAVVAVYVLYPIFAVSYGNQSRPANRSGLTSRTEIRNLIDEKERIYSELRDIEFDYRLGKITDEDYRELNRRYKLKAARVIEKLENLKAS